MLELANDKLEITFHEEDDLDDARQCIDTLMRAMSARDRYDWLVRASVELSHDSPYQSCLLVVVNEELKSLIQEIPNITAEGG